MNKKSENYDKNVENSNYENEIEKLKDKLSKVEMENNELKKIISEQKLKSQINDSKEDNDEYDAVEEFEHNNEENYDEDNEEVDDNEYEDNEKDEKKCPYCGSNNIQVQLIRKGMTLQGTILFLALLLGGLTMPVAIWYWVDCNSLKEHGVCTNCGNSWIKKKK